MQIGWVSLRRSSSAILDDFRLDQGAAERHLEPSFSAQVEAFGLLGIYFVLHIDHVDSSINNACAFEQANSGASAIILAA